MVRDNNKIFLKNGTFEATLANPAKIKTKVTIMNNRISDVKIKSLKGEREIEPDLQEEFKGQIIHAQSVKIDGVSRASVLTKAVKSVVGEALAEARYE